MSCSFKHARIMSAMERACSMATGNHYCRSGGTGNRAPESWSDIEPYGSQKVGRGDEPSESKLSSIIYTYIYNVCVCVKGPYECPIHPHRNPSGTY